MVRVGDGDPQLLDGRHRLDLLEEIGTEVVDEAGKLLVRHEIIPVADDAEAERLSLSLNAHRRHLTAEQRRDLIAAVLKANPEKSDRQIAKAVKASPTFVGKVRAEKEATGEVSTVDTRIDAKGVKQPATKPGRGRGPRHVCWQCGRRGKIGEVQQHHYAQYDDDADVWLHDACISAFDQAEQQRKQLREAAAGRIKALMGGKTAPRDDIGSDSSSELGRLRAQVDELQDKLRQRDIKIIGLEGEVEDLKAAEARFSGHLDALQLVDLLERRLERDGINAAAQLKKIRAWIEQAHPTVDLTAMRAAGSA
jgi:hypothetical protein